MDWIFWAGAVVAGGVVTAMGFLAWILVRGGDTRIEEDDYPVQNDFGVSMDRFGYIQDARNGGRK